jgi:hypothetical protein
MAQENENIDPEWKRKGIFDENDGMPDAFGDNAVTKIYVDGNEYYSVDDIPPEVRDKMSETLLHVQQESNKPEDLSSVFKQQKKRLRYPAVTFGGRSEDIQAPTLNIGKIALISIGIVVIFAILYLIIMR